MIALLIREDAPAVPLVNTTVAAILDTTTVLLANGGMHVEPGELRLALEHAVPSTHPDPVDRAELAAMGLGVFLQKEHPQVLTWEDTTAKGVFALARFCSRTWLIEQLTAAAAWHRELAALRAVA